MTGILATSAFLFLANPVMAQDASTSTSDMNTTDNDHDNNFGWIGLIGLAGLLGLRKKDDRRTTISHGTGSTTTR